MMLEDWASSGDGIRDSKMDYLLRVPVSWIVKHVADKEDVWQKNTRLSPFVAWVTHG